jgi:hypothetical protein
LSVIEILQQQRSQSLAKSMLSISYHYDAEFERQLRSSPRKSTQPAATMSHTVLT